MKCIILTALVALSGCSSEIVDRQGKKHTIKDSLIKTKTRKIDQTYTPTRYNHRVSCSYTGYCFACGLGMDGKMECGMGWKIAAWAGRLPPALELSGL